MHTAGLAYLNKRRRFLMHTEGWLTWINGVVRFYSAAMSPFHYVGAV